MGVSSIWVRRAPARGDARTGFLVDESVYKGWVVAWPRRRRIRVSRDTHARVTGLAAERYETIDESVSSAIRALRQDAMARDLAADLNVEETDWLDAEAR